MKIKGLLKKIAVVIIILLVLIPVLIKMFGNKALKTGIEKTASKTLKVDVTLEDISLSLLKGAVELDNLVIANPEGYQNPTLLEAGNAKIDVGLKSLTSDTVKIDNMIFNDVTVTIEQKGMTNNLQQILDSLPEPDEKPDDKEKKAKNLLVKNLEMNNIQVKIKMLPIPGRADTLKLKLAPIKMENLGTENKMSIATLTAKIMSAIALGVAQQGADLLPKEIIGPMKDALGVGAGALIEGGKGLMKGTGDVLKGGAEAGKGITDGIKGLFNNKTKEEEE